MNEPKRLDSSARPMRVERVRRLSVVLPVLYLAGVWIAASEAGPADGSVGLLMIVAALGGAVFGLQGTGIQRVAGECPEYLDEGERLIRDRVLARSYRIFAVTMVVGIVYADIGADINRKLEWALPLPQGDLLYTSGAVILFALLLPAALLAWRLPADEITEDPPA